MSGPLLGEPNESIWMAENKLQEQNKGTKRGREKEKGIFDERIAYFKGQGLLHQFKYLILIVYDLSSNIQTVWKKPKMIVWSI